MKKITVKDKVRYKIDNIMAKGTKALVILLAIITLSIAILAGLVVLLVQSGWYSGPVTQTIWKSFLLTLDSGNLSGIDGNVLLIVIAAIVTICGLFITSTLIGIINSGLESKLNNLRKGTSRVIEKDHTVILGYNESVFTILSELVIANENKTNACIVLLGNEDKQVMEEAIANRITEPKKTRIICRSGSSFDYFDLMKCSIDTCKSIIINENDDFLVMKTLLAISNLLEKENATDCKAHISALMNSQENINAAQIASQGRAELVYFASAMSRIMAHVCYQPGLSAVYTDLFDFGGDEIYFEKFPELKGKKFIEVLPLFEKSTVIGIKKGDMVTLNPSMDTVLEEQDEIILIAEDDGVSFPKESSIQPNSALCVAEDSQKVERQPQELLVIGYNKLLINIVKELDSYMAKGSSIKIASGYENIEEELSALCGNTENVQIDAEYCDICNRAVLEKLSDGKVENILILSDLFSNDKMADEKALLVLLNLRDIARKHNKKFSITSEFIDIKNQELAGITDVSDFVVSSNVASLIITQISENRYLAPVFEDLLDSDGSEIYMKPASKYIKTGETIDLYTAAHSAAMRGEIFLGYKKVIENDERRKIEIITNPQKSQEVVFTEDDWFIVLAEEY